MLFLRTNMQNGFRLMVIAAGLIWVWVTAGFIVDPLLQMILRWGSFTVAVGLTYQLLSGRAHGYYAAVACAYAIMIGMIVDLGGTSESTLRVVSITSEEGTQTLRYSRLSHEEVEAQRLLESLMALNDAADQEGVEPPVGRSGFAPADFVLPSEAGPTVLH